MDVVDFFPEFFGGEEVAVVSAASLPEAKFALGVPEAFEYRGVYCLPPLDHTLRERAFEAAKEIRNIFRQRMISSLGATLRPEGRCVVGLRDTRRPDDHMKMLWHDHPGVNFHFHQGLHQAKMLDERILDRVISKQRQTLIARAGQIPGVVQAFMTLQALLWE